MDRPACWDLNYSKSLLVNAQNSGPGGNLFNYHDGGARNVTAMPDMGVSGVGNVKCNSPVKVEHRPQRQESNASSADVNWHTYLEQGKNEYVSLTSQIAYDGSNIVFVFYENQIRRLMDGSPFEERKLEVLRASCVGQPREMVNLFCALMKSMTTALRIKKALDRLIQRYGVSGGLTSEPNVRAIRNGAKVPLTRLHLKYVTNI